MCWSILKQRAHDSLCASFCSATISACACARSPYIVVSVPIVTATCLQFLHTARIALKKLKLCFVPVAVLYNATSVFEGGDPELFA